MPWINDKTFQKENCGIIKTKFKLGDQVQYTISSGNRREIHISIIVSPFAWYPALDPEMAIIGYVLQDGTRANEEQLSGVGNA